MSNPVPTSRSAAIGTVIAGVAAGIGWKAAAFGHGMGGWHRGGLMGAALDPARLDERLDHMLRRLDVETLASCKAGPIRLVLASISPSSTPEAW